MDQDHQLRSAYLGVFIPSAVIILLGIVWVATGSPGISTDYATPTNWMPDLTKWDTIVFLSSMMFAFARSGSGSDEFTVVPAIRSADFPRAMAMSAIVIVGIYMIGTVAVNTLVPAKDTDIVAGIMQAMESAANTLGIPLAITLMAICLLFGALGQINSWLVGPILMFAGSFREDKLLGDKISELHPKYGTPLLP